MDAPFRSAVAQVSHWEASFDGKGLSFAIIASRFNRFIVNELVNGACEALLKHQVESKHIQVIWVPGALEIPSAAQRLAKMKCFDALICLGVILQGGTHHHEVVSTSASSGLSQISLSEQIPITSGIITTESIEQAIERSGTRYGNKGFDTAMAALEMTSLLKQLEHLKL